MRAAVVDLGAQPVRNMLTRPRPDGSGSWGVQTPSGSSATVQPSAGPFAESALVVAVGSQGALRMRFNGGLDKIAIAGGSTYTALAWVYSPRALSGVGFEFALEGASSTSYVLGSTFSLVPGWQVVRSTVTATADRLRVSQIQILTQNSAGNTAVGGDEFRMARAMLTEGVYLGSPLDGDTPGWRWLGTAGASESVGYPLPTFFGPNPDTLADVAVGYQAGIIERSDSRAPTGMPFARAVHMGGFDSRLLWKLGAVPYAPGVQDWVLEGWLSAVDAIAYSGTAASAPNMDRFRFGTNYGNDGPNGITTTSVIQGTTITRADFLNVWKPFRQVYRLTVPANANLGGYFCPNLSGQGWLLAGGRFRRAAPGELVV